MADDGIVIRISGDPKDFEKAANDVKKLFGGISEDAKKESGVATAAWGSFIGNFASQAAIGAIGLVKDAIGSVFGALKAGIGDALEADKAVQKFNLSLANTGKFSEQTSEDFQKYADELEATTGIAGEAVLANAALIQSLGKLDSDGLKRATGAAADLSAAIGVDFDTASNLLAKASQGNVEALKKYGIQVEDTGNSARDFETALKAIEQQFGGAATQSVNTFAGQLAIAKNAFDDVFQSFGQQVTSTPALKGLAEGLGTVFRDLQQLIEDNKESIQSFISEGVDLFISGIGLAGKAVSGFFELQSGFQTFSSFITDTLIATVQTFEEFGLGIAEAKLKIEEFFGVNSEGTQAAIADYKTRIQALQEVRDEELAATNEQIAQNEARVQAIDNFTNQSLEKLRASVAESKALGEQENIDYLEKRSQRAATTLEQDAAELAQFQAYQQQVLDSSQGFLTQGQINELKTQTDRLANEQKFVEAKNKLLKQDEQNRLKSAEVQAKIEQAKQQSIFDVTNAGLGLAAALTKGASKEIFLLQKAAAIAQTIIAAEQASALALAQPPGPPTTLPLAAAARVKGFASVAAIAASAIQGFANGGLISGGVPGIDSVPILAQQGEIVAPPRSFDEVVEGTARQRGFVQGDENAGVIQAIQELRESISNIASVTLQVGTLVADDNGINELADRLRDAVQFRGAQLS